MTFERIRLRYQYLIEKSEIDGNVKNACALLNRISDTIAVIREFLILNALTKDENMKQECVDMLVNLSDKKDKLEDALEGIKFSLKFD